MTIFELTIFGRLRFIGVCEAHPGKPANIRIIARWFVHLSFQGDLFRHLISQQSYAENIQVFFEIFTH